MSVKRTISFSASTLERLDSAVPKSKRSRFIDEAVTEALLQVAKEQALEALANFPKIKSGDKDVVETLREIRAQESSKYRN